MIIVLDVIIITFITFFSIYHGSSSNLLNETFKLFSLLFSTLIAIPLSKIAGDITLNQIGILFDTNTNILDAKFFYMISFILLFLIINYIILSISNVIKDLINYKINPNSYFNKILSTFFAMLRSILIIAILIYCIESSIFNTDYLINNLILSPSYKAFSSFTYQVF